MKTVNEEIPRRRYVRIYIIFQYEFRLLQNVSPNHLGVFVCNILIYTVLVRVYQIKKTIVRKRPPQRVVRRGRVRKTVNR